MWFRSCPTVTDLNFERRSGENRRNGETWTCMQGHGIDLKGPEVNENRPFWQEQPGALITDGCTTHFAWLC